MPHKVKRVDKPWGYELWWARTKAYVGKIIALKKGHRLSLQYHKRKSETLLVLKGTLRLVHGNKKLTLRTGSAYDIKPGEVHRFEAPFGPVTLIEVSTPQLDDIVRLSDDYGRA